jgi:cell division septation protein DedD
MANGFFGSNRSQRESESRMSNERSRDFGGAQSQGSDQGGADRRDPGADALLELARLIGQNDSLPPEASKSETRLGDISRTAASQADAGRNSFMERASSRREPDFGEPSRASRGAGAGFDFPPLSGRGAFGSRHAAPEERDYDRGGRGRPDYGRPDSHHGQDGDAEYGTEPDDFDEDEQVTTRRRPTRAIMAVLGLAVFGSAAAYGYRTIISAPSGPTPIIRADNSPTKITPMSDVRADSGRIGDRIGEQLVRRDEDPIDVGRSRGVDAPGQPDITPATASPGDPKRVQTVPIRADQGTGSADRASSRSVTLPAQSAPPQPRQVAPAPQPPSPPPQRQAALAPPAASPPPDMAAPVESGGYVVQLTAQRSEAEAQTSFRNLQVKYPVLSGRQPLIRRKDQGDRGIFFAAQVGPFGAKSDADQLCEQLKSAGGSCFVQRN